MTNFTEILINNAYYILVFVFIFAAVQGMIFLYQRLIVDRLHLQSRLKSTVVANAETLALDELLVARGLTAAGKLRFPLFRSLNEDLVRSGLTIGFLMVVFGMIVVCVMITIILRLRGYSVFISFPIGVSIGYFVPVFILKNVARRRIAKFGDQLADALSMISRSLRVGHPLPVAIRMVGREMPDPIGSEFAIVSSELAAGLPLKQAVKNLEGRVGQDDLAMLVSSIVIQSETGGNLGEVLDLLSKLIRTRVKLRRKVMAITSEGRISARAMTGLPFFLYLILLFTAPDYYTVAWKDWLTPIVLGFAGVWMLIGNLVMMNMVNIKY